MDTDPQTYETSLVRFFDLIDSFVRQELDPPDLCRVGVEELSNVASVVADVFETANFIFLPQVHENRAQIFSVAVWSFKLGFNRIYSEVVAVVATLVEGRLGYDFLVCDADHDRVFFVVFWQGDCSINLSHELESAVHKIFLGCFDVLLRDLLHLVDGLLGLNGKDLHENAALPEAAQFRVLVHVLRSFVCLV